MNLDEFRATVSTWLTIALDHRYAGDLEDDLLRLRDWIDGGSVGEVPWPGQ